MREWAAAAKATTTVDDFLAVVGQVLRPAAVRSDGLIVVAFEAAVTDPTMKALAGQLGRQRARTVAWIVDGVIERAPLRAEISRAHAIDIVWLLMDPIVFCRLTRDRRWSSEQFERWFTDSISRLLLPANGSPP